MVTLFSLIPFYLIGTFPTGRLVALYHGVNIEKQGSGNVGATNVARVIGKRAGILTLAGDLLKGIISVVGARVLIAEASLVPLAGLCAVAGHCFSIPGLVKGGKGVATALGVLLILDPLAALGTCLIFAAVLSTFKMVSAASVSAALTAPLILLLLDRPDSVVFAIVGIALIVTLRHRTNITRIIQGEEPRFGMKKG